LIWLLGGTFYRQALSLPINPHTADIIGEFIMRRILYYGGPLLATCLALTGLSSAFADTTTVVTKTTTVDTSPSFILPSSTYVVVDPLTGVIRGDYTSGIRVIDGTPLNSSYVVMDKVTRRLVGTFDDSGNLIDISAAPAASSVIVSVDSHRAALESQIFSLLAQGQITGHQAEVLQADIARLFPGETTTTRTVTYSNALTADSGLYRVESRLLPFAQKSVTATVVVPRFVTLDGHLVMPDTLTYRKLQLERRIEDEFAFGHLTKDQLFHFKSDMTDISNREARYLAVGPMTDTNARIMAADLNAVQAKLDQCIANRNAGLNIGAK
jgi:hypothetical protein